MYAEPAGGASHCSWLDAKHEDMAENFLYQTFGEQLISSPRPIRSYADWALYVAAKAVISLLATGPQGEQLLRETHPAALPLPRRRDVLPWLDGEPVDLLDPNAWILQLFREVPGLLVATETLLLEYANAVRAERARLKRSGQRVLDTPLPDDPAAGVLLQRLQIPEEVRIERAIEAFLTGEGNYKEIAATFGIGQKRFMAILQERRINRSRGGDWRQYRHR